MARKCKLPAAALLVLVGILVFGPGPAAVRGETESGRRRLGAAEVYAAEKAAFPSASVYKTLDMWHYSGGYWMVGNAGSSKLKVTDKEMAARGVAGILGGGEAEFRAPLPDEVRAALAEGREITVEAFGRNAPLSKLFAEGSTSAYIDAGSGEAVLKGIPRFNLSTLSFSDYGLKLGVSVPLIDQAFGWNIYAVYGGPKDGLQAAGWTDTSNPFDLSALPVGYIHPGIIADNTGKLKAGYQIALAGLLVDSGKLRIGNGTFANGGAVGVSFVYSISFGFAEVGQEIEEPEPQEDEENSPIGAPVLDVTLSGRQTANRKQVLNVGVTFNRNCPIYELWAEIKDTVTGETVHLDLDGSIDNSSSVFTRAFEHREGFSLGHLYAELPFLTKHGENRVFRYKVYAKDADGQTAAVSESFTVQADLPPEAKINIAESFFRKPGTMKADIYAENGSDGHGDKLVCEWTMPEGIAEYRYAISGSTNAVEFQKEGVGEFSLGLKVSDVWGDEETLPEYVSPEDRLSAVCSASSLVDNRAPIVGVNIGKTKKAELLILTDSPECLAAIRLCENAITEALLAEGLETEMSAALLPAEGSSEGQLSVGEEIRVPYGFSPGWNGFLESGSTAADEQNIYKFSSSWVQTANYTIEPCAPYEIRCCRRSDSAVLWTCRLTAEELPVRNNNISAYFGQDSQGKYLYLIADGRTYLIDKATGILSGSFAAALGRCNVLGDRCIYSFSTDGICKLSLASGEYKRIVQINILSGCARALGGRQVFVCRLGNALFKGVFSPSDEDVQYYALEGCEDFQPSWTHSLVAIDSRGRMAAVSNGTCRIWAPDGKLIASRPLSGCINPVFDACGRMNYIASAAHDTYYDYRTIVNLWGIENGYSGQCIYTDRSGYPTNDSQFVFGMELPDGKVYTAYGATRVFIANVSMYMYNGAMHGMPETLKITCFDTAGSAVTANAQLPGISLESTIEYGMQMPGLVLLNTGDNNYTQSSAANISKPLHFSESQEGTEERISAQVLSYKTDFTFIRRYMGEEASAFSAEELVRSLIAESKEGSQTLFLKAEEPSGGAVKQSVKLKPDTTYYYEYDSSQQTDILEIRDAFSESEATDGYRITGLETEDFNGETLNPFFSYREGSKTDNTYQMVFIRYDYSERFGASGHGALGFTVPEGKTAVLAFDYDIRDVNYTGRSGPYSNYFTITKEGCPAQYWHMTRQDSHSGHYTHTDLLDAGNYTLDAYGYNYGYDTTAYMRIDNLALAFVEPAENYSYGSGPMAKDESCVSEAENGFRIEGSFTTPLETASFGRLETEKHFGEDDTLITDTNGDGTESIKLDIPEDKLALYMTVDIESAHITASKYDTNSYRYVYPLYPSNFSWGSVSWARYNSPYPSEMSKQSPAGKYTVYGYDLTGTQTVNSSFKYYEPAYGRFTECVGYGKGDLSNPKAWLADNTKPLPSGVQNRSFFIAGDELYYQDAKFNGFANLCLNASPGEETRIDDLRIYYYENGEKIYVNIDPVWENAGAKCYSGKYAPEAESDVSPMVYKKGEYINYNISYSDIEKDPSVKESWEFIHTPAKGEKTYELSGTEQSEAVHRFNDGGKYVLRHYQVDDPYRNGTGGPLSKQSNVYELTFYIEGESSGSENQAPKIKLMKTEPETVSYASIYAIAVQPSDADKDELSLDLDIYLDGRLIYTSSAAQILPKADGSYPAVMFRVNETAEYGEYTAVATVSDAQASAYKTLRFTIKKPEPKFRLRIHRKF